MRIGVVGSMHFTEEMLEIKKKLEKKGHDVYIIDLADPFVGLNDQERDKLKHAQRQTYDPFKMFWNQMQGGDALLVVNLKRHGIPNYIGGNTLMELGFAHILNQIIYLLNPIPEIPYYKSEIEAMNPIILNGDLTKIHQ